MSMTAVEMLVRYNSWTTGVLIDEAAKLAPEEYHQQFDIGLGSVHDTLRHIVGAMLRWADRISGRPLRDSIESGEPLPPARLRELLAQADAELREAAAVADSRGWDSEIEFPREGGPPYHFTRLAAMLHVLTHGTHHRAQVLNMRRQLGLPALPLDLDVVEWECMATGQLA
ncbi:MAG: DinB family protein [Phycisphaerales bacterium]|nr:DinB family protein [Phycisphaerales bacterium]